jgi:hypothetical protein
MRPPERYPYEHAIEDLMWEHFNTSWSFEAVRTCPTAKSSIRMKAIRDLVYEAMQKSFNDGIDFQKAAKRGMSV